MDNPSWFYALLLLPLCMVTELGIRRWAPPGMRWWFRLAVLLKVGLGIVVGWLYATHWGGGDTWAMFEESGRLLEILPAQPGAYFEAYLGRAPQGNFRYSHEPRALCTAALLSIPRFLGGGHYYLTSIWVSIMASWGLLFGLCGFHRAGYRVWPWLLGLCLWPSVAFWSAGIMKETFMLGLMGYILGLVLPTVKGREPMRWWQAVLVLLAFIVLWQIKYYAAGLLFAALGAAWLGQWARHRWRSRVGWGVFAGAWVLLLLGATTTYPRLQPSQLLPTLFGNYQRFLLQATEGEVAHYAAWNGTLRGAVLSTPEVLMTGMFRPWLGETWHGWSTLAAVENGGLLLLVLGSLVWRLRRPKGARQGLEPAAVSALIFVLIAVVLVGLGTPNFGTLIRYRVLWMPVVVAWSVRPMLLGVQRK